MCDSRAGRRALNLTKRNTSQSKQSWVADRRAKDSQLLHARRRRAIRSDAHVEAALDRYRRKDLVVRLRKVEKTATTLGEIEEGRRSVVGANGLRETSKDASNQPSLRSRSNGSIKVHVRVKEERWGYNEGVRPLGASRRR